MLLQELPLDTSAFAGSGWRLAAGGVFSVLLVTACATDLRWRRVPNWLVATLAILGLTFSIWIAPGWSGVARGVSGLVVGFGIWIVFYLVGGMGAGDVKLFAAAAAWLGPGGAWRAALLAALVGGVLSIVALLWQRRFREGATRVAIAISSMSTAPLGAVEAGVERRHYLPYAIALSAGALLVGWIPGIFAIWRTI